MNESHTAAKIRSIRSYSRQDGGAPTNPQPLAPQPQHLLPESVDSHPFNPFPLLPTPYSLLPPHSPHHRHRKRTRHRIRHHARLAIDIDQQRALERRPLHDTHACAGV